MALRDFLVTPWSMIVVLASGLAVSPWASGETLVYEESFIDPSPPLLPLSSVQSGTGVSELELIAFFPDQVSTGVYPVVATDNGVTVSYTVETEFLSGFGDISKLGFDWSYTGNQYSNLYLSVKQDSGFFSTFRVLQDTVDAGGGLNEGRIGILMSTDPNNTFGGYTLTGVSFYGVPVTIPSPQAGVAGVMGLGLLVRRRRG